MEYGSGWVWASEGDKWATFSRQRFVNVNVDGNMLQVEICGAVSKNITIAVLDLNNENEQTIVNGVNGERCNDQYIYFIHGSQLMP